MPSATAGGICGGGDGPATYSATASLANCYYLSGTNTLGTDLSVTGLTTANIYAPNGSWSDSGASSALVGVPTGIGVGTVWASTALNTPYLLSSYTASYSNPTPVIVAGGTTGPGPYTGGVYSILTCNGSSTIPPGVTINPTTGAITITVPGTYDVVVFYQGSYYFLSLLIDVGALPCLVRGSSRVLNGYRPIEKIAADDVVCVHGGRLARVQNIMSSTVSHNVPYVLRKGEIDGIRPFRDVLLSANHEYYNRRRGRMERPARVLRASPLFREEDTVEYFHLSTGDKTDRLICEGIEVASWDGEF